MRLEMKTVFHLSSDTHHLRIERCERYNFERWVNVPVLECWGGFYKKFGKPIVLYRFQDETRWEAPKPFLRRLAARYDPEGFNRYQRARRQAQQSKRRWRRNRHRIKILNYAFKNTKDEPSQI